MAASGYARILKACGPRWVHRLLGVAKCTFPIGTSSLTVRDLDAPPVLRFFLGTERGQSIAAAVATGDTVKAGQPLGKAGDQLVRPSPVNGTVKGVGEGPDVRAGRMGLTVTIEPDAGTSPDAFAPLDPGNATREEILARLREAGIRMGALGLVRLDDVLTSTTLIVLAADREPNVHVAAQLLEDRAADVGRALEFLGRAAGAERLFLAAPEPKGKLATKACSGIQASVLGLPPVYPESLEPMVALRAGDPAAAVVPLETALAALDAVAEGRVQDHKLVTLVWTGREPAVNLRVALGTRLADLVTACDLEVHELDKLVAGGPMQGFAQYSLDASVDEGVDAIVVTRAEDVVPFSDNPCINCGACIDVCPARLQVQLIGRYSEFGKFDPVRDLDIEQCIECGLCATICTGRRPLMQMIRLARQQLVPGEKPDTGDEPIEEEG